MERLWSPWRYEYVAAGASADASQRGCVFCSIKADPSNDETNFVLHRAKFNFIVLNIHPYITGHLLIVPYEHIANLDAATKETTDELMDLTKRAQTALRRAYNPAGYNIGINLGSAAGAGIVDHIHTHIMPRWVGDTNFMSTIGQTRVLPEDLPTTHQKLRDKF
ncbi:MAG: HIT domain-containing protein [Acidobacteriota bacterium]